LGIADQFALLNLAAAPKFSIARRINPMYRVHRFNLSMTNDQQKLETFLNRIDGEVVAIIPNVTPFPATFVNFVLVVEKLANDSEISAFKETAFSL
jgi:hypothetical protein